jgi:Fe-S-cluster containining protein
MSKTETAEEAIATAGERLKQVTASFPRRLNVLEGQLLKKLGRATSKSEQLTLLYKTADELFSAVTAKTPCQRGCSACCHIPVQISLNEAERIQERTGAEVIGPLPVGNFHGVPCPLLKDGECSIYPDRPFACRRHVVFFATAYWCDVDRCNTIIAPQMRVTELETGFKQLLGNSPLVDIRQMFAPDPRPVRPSSAE